MPHSAPRLWFKSNGAAILRTTVIRKPFIRSPDRRGGSTARGYGSRWQKARATFLENNALCRVCSAEQLVVPAGVVDHIQPRRGDQKLFWDTANWQALCARCHNKKTARGE